LRPGPPVEDVAGQREHKVAGTWRKPSNRIIDQQHGRQEPQNERLGTEDHATPPLIDTFIISIPEEFSTLSSGSGCGVL
jgi:hypothetical protein